ncbi:hypothetical protein Q4485_12390 [Granulosicoccaceae sp. 1_MG-2023]|nr:hypothetical protein [Granulosicoccaceae sp. 1_MG-2023]
MISDIRLRLSAALCCSLLGACSGASVSTTDGVSVDLWAEVTQSAQADGSVPRAETGPKHVTTSEGIRITLDSAYLVLWQLALKSDCSGSNFAPAPWWLGWISNAYAHVESTPWQSGIPQIIDITSAEGTTQWLDTLNPTPGHYCGASVQIKAADDDANGLDTAPHMEGYSVYLQGSYLQDGQNTPFTVASSKTLFPAERLFPAALIIDSEHKSGAVSFALHYDRWFDGVDLRLLAQGDIPDSLLTNIVNSISATAD